jgi:hypothetical protein
MMGNAVLGVRQPFAALLATENSSPARLTVYEVWPAFCESLSAWDIRKKYQSPWRTAVGAVARERD